MSESELYYLYYRSKLRRDRKSRGGGLINPSRTRNQYIYIILGADSSVFSKEVGKAVGLSRAHDLPTT